MRFNFSFTYRPGSKNSKADALSRIHDSVDSQMRPETILPPSIIIAPIQWDIMEEIQHVLHEEPSPPECPAGKIYAPSSLRNRIIQWAHTSLASGHPGINRTTALVRNSFWWSTLSADVKSYVTACQICAQSRTPWQLPAGLLEPLPIPQRPWSHLSIDFVTDLPNSQGFTTIMVSIDRFSKSCRLIPLKGLPTAMGTAQVLFNQVFRIYRLPDDIVTDRGPQFTSRVWGAFCKHFHIGLSSSS